MYASHPRVPLIMPSLRRIGILTGGGDAPGLNAVIRAVVKTAHNSGVEVLGLEDSFDGLIYPEKSRLLTPRDKPCGWTVEPAVRRDCRGNRDRRSRRAGR